MRKRGIPEKLFRLVIETYKESKTTVRTAQALSRVYTTEVRPVFGVWVRMLEPNEERSNKITNSRMSLQQKMLGVTLRDKLRKKKNNCDNECSNSSGTNNLP